METNIVTPYDCNKRRQKAEQAALSNPLLMLSCQFSSGYPWQVSAIDKMTHTLICRRFQTAAVAEVFAQALASTHDCIMLEQVAT
jgi:hypothetical protein